MKLSLEVKSVILAVAFALFAAFSWWFFARSVIAYRDAHAVPNMQSDLCGGTSMPDGAIACRCKTECKWVTP